MREGRIKEHKVKRYRTKQKKKRNFINTNNGRESSNLKERRRKTAKNIGRARKKNALEEKNYRRKQREQLR
jgi:hypothetical protein